MSCLFGRGIEYITVDILIEMLVSAVAACFLCFIWISLPYLHDPPTACQGN